MKKLLIALIALSSIPALTMSSAMRRARLGQTPAAPVASAPVVIAAPAPANNQGLSDAIAAFNKALANTTAQTTFIAKVQNLKTGISTLEAIAAPIIPLTQAQHDALTVVLHKAWKEVNDLITPCSNLFSPFIPFYGNEDVTIIELKDLKFKIASIAQTQTGSILQLGYTVPAYVDRYWKQAASVAALALWATYRLGVGSHVGNAVPKGLSSAWNLAKWIAVGNQSTTQTPEQIAPAAKGWFAQALEMLPQAAQ